MNEFEMEERARCFWADTGWADVYPRPIEQAIALKLPVTVVKLPIVTVRAVARWLQRHKRYPEFPPYTRDLMGCLYADGGHGFIFLCGTDNADEQRFTLAHDTAHFLVDYWWPRERVIQVLGAAAVEVLDGFRAATSAERVSAVLAHVRIGPHCHLLPRPGREPETDDCIACVEDRADDMGLELVAPRKCVKEWLRTQTVHRNDDIDGICGTLGLRFGLPGYVFRAIATESCRPPTPSFLDDVLHALRRES
jgi:hypothetical protein